MEMSGSSNVSEEELESFYAYGYAHYESGNLSEAMDAFRILCTKKPFEPRFWFALAATLQKGEEYCQATDVWAMSALLNRDDPYPHFHAAECCLSLRKIEEAAKALKESEQRVEGGHPLKDKITLLKKQWQLE